MEQPGTPPRIPGKICASYVVLVPIIDSHVAKTPASRQQIDQLRQFGRELIQGNVLHHAEDVEDDITHSNGDDCRLAVEVLTRQAKKGTIRSCVIGN